MYPAIRCNDLGKRYRVSGTAVRGGSRYRTLREDLMRWLSAPLRGWRGGGDAAEDFWALRDVSFEVQPGEIVGLIGRNGAGKSTLLKILSRVTSPTTGQVELFGRTGSLLDVTTGFHQELTGRENVFLSGAILGMRRREIAAKFDRIAEFAEVGPFLDTPVKHYSSGMAVRLAFAVAAHLEPEILIIDEVLAVGDLAFQRKCLDRIHEQGRSGCTVLFVSHNVAAVEALCTRALLLDAGRVLRDGSVPDLVREYRHRVLGTEGADTLAAQAGPGRPNPVFSWVTLLNERGQPTNYLPVGGKFHLRVGLQVAAPLDCPTIAVGIDDATGGKRLLTVHTPLVGPPLEHLTGRCAIDCRIDHFPLAPGEYRLELALAARGHEIDRAERALHFTVTDGDACGAGSGFAGGLCVAPSRWDLVEIHEENQP